MQQLYKEKNKDFIILNFSDPQISGKAFTEKRQDSITFFDTARKLIDEFKPDLITITGDYSITGDLKSYEFFGEFFNSFNIPFAPIFGNHDCQGEEKMIEKQADIFSSYSNCLFENGDRDLGFGNYVVKIKEKETDKVVEGLIFMDSHDRVPYKNKNGKECLAYAKLTEKQLAWYSEQIEKLKKEGCFDTSLFCHIPIFVFNKVLDTYLKPNVKEKTIKWEKSLKYDWDVCNRIKPYNSKNSDIWKEGVEVDGAFNEYGGNFPEDDGVFDLIKELGTTKNVFVGHHHMNSYSAVYKGVRLTHCLKSGTGAYFADGINGGTVIKIDSNGVKEVLQKYVDIDKKYLKDLYLVPTNNEE